MTTHIYVLSHKDHMVVEDISPVWRASRVPVQGRDWYGARARCIDHALTNGHSKIIVVVGTVELYRRPHWNGNGPETVPHRVNQEDQHGLWLYLDRLLNRFGHVYVPPMSACRSWQSMRKHPWSYLNTPVIPSVAGYQMNALATLDTGAHAEPFGQRLCANGYDSLTVSDYFFHNLGDHVLDESGSTTTWNRAYERAISRHL